MSTSESSTPGLVVPVDVVAFCVGNADANDPYQGTPTFAGATVIYSQQTQTQNLQTQDDQNLPPPAYLGANAWCGLDQPAWNALEAGVHIHWALPDALTDAPVDKNTSDVQFPAVPNRWLVTRMVIDGGTPSSVTSWVVESDAFSSPANWKLPTVALQPGTSAPDFAHLGQCTPLDSYQPSTLLNGPRTFALATGAELSAISNGMPTFAAYYPESRTAFGFVDTLADLAALQLSASATLMYAVTGWFDATANDPASAGGDLAETHQWQAGEQAAYTLFSGLVQGIVWNPETHYVLDQPNQAAITARAAVGNTPIEALSAYFRDLLQPGNALFEQMLCAFQAGLLPRFSEPGPGMLAKLAEALHDNGFQAVDAGLIYSIVVTAPDGTQTEATDLPPPIAVALNLLNVKAQAFEEVATSVESFKWRMFADWYRYFQTDPDYNDAVFNHSGLLYADWTQANTGLKARHDQARKALNDQLGQLTALLAALPNTPFTLKPSPAPRYWQPADPAVLLASPGKPHELSFPARYGSDGLLPCRTTDQVVTSVTVGGTTFDKTAFAALCGLPGQKLPYADACANLLAEACLLNTHIAASRSGKAEATLAADLQALLAGQQQANWTIGAGQAPSPVELAWWGGQNPWLPLFLQWTVQFAPLQATETTTGNGPALTPYPVDYFAANYRVDTTTGSFVSCAPGVTVPDASAFTQSWSGYSVLSPTTADNLATAIKDDPHDGPVLQPILDSLNRLTPLVQPLSGFTAGLLMQQQIPQLQIVIPEDNSDLGSPTITANTTNVTGQIYHIGPQFFWPYNPVRAGWMKFSLQAVDVFGQKRNLDLGPITMAESMDADGAHDVAYLAPRLAQPGRLLFDWISSGAGGLVEMNDHPAMSPVCGWLLPNHLNHGFFLYDAAGRPLGSLLLSGDQSSVIWQSAPGDDATIDQAPEQALADVNPTFKALALALANGTPQWFQSVCKAVDRVQAGISPGLLAADAGLPILIGRPIAVAQAALRLDMRGRTALNQRFSCLDTNKGSWADIDSGFSAVQYPVLLGDADNLDDGLIGFFLPRGHDDGYRFSTFFTGGALPGDDARVAQPQQTTILLTPTPAFDAPEPPPLAQQSLPLLMLIDPRAPVHATTGILPTQSLLIPPDLAAAAVSRLEMSFPVAPILRPASLRMPSTPTAEPVGRLVLPIPSESGYAVSFLEQDQGDGRPHWITVSDIGRPPGGAVWNYTPQTLTEGWLRLNPTLLSFDLLDSGGKALVMGGQTQSVTLRVTNRKLAPITFLPPGKFMPEGEPLANGSIVYLHFGALVDPANVTGMSLSAAAWRFQAFHDDLYGHYWAAIPTTQAALAPAQSFDIQISGLTAVANAVQAELYIDYYGVGGVSDGVFADLVTITKSGS
ncbi:hypothetical protein [Burkholderia ubonensis]|uniref:hypothetical protein n=1 Tax=Burkholderia ubonensis TaxID=101571 RepID=UPI00075730A4|nr:hypothetical protein [Burkholderia ubonensis]KUZ80128.1 hypothetical protein WI37_08330 [Burkholderia ubonensis]